MDEPLANVLRARWRQLLAPFVDAPMADGAFADLVSHYSDPARHYHDLTHVASVLDGIGVLWPTAPLPLVLAGWLHDVVYDTRSADNEARSADYARGLGEKLSFLPDVIDETARLILLTRTHEAAPADQAGQVLLDADLAILAASEEQYDAYAEAIRREYAWVPEADFRRGRAAVLQRFLARECIYFTPAMRQQAEPRARANLAREIAHL